VSRPKLAERLKSSGLSLPTALLLTALVACGVAASAAALRASSASRPAATAAFSPAAAPASFNPDPPRVVRFAVYDAGIYPREATVEHGRVVFVMEDNTGGEASLVVEREQNGGREQVGRVERAHGRARGRGEYRLSPGRYEIYDAARPEVRAVLTVEP
jgi:hypothetical protein